MVTDQSAPTDDMLTNEEENEDGFSFMRWTFIIVGMIIALYVVIFLFGLIAALVNVEWARPFFAYFRNLILLLLSFTSILIVVGTGVLLVQIARFVNLLKSEVQPITRDAQEAVKTVRTTTEFVQKNAVEPIIQTSSFLAGLLTFLREIARLSRLLQQRDTEDKDDA